MRKWKKLPRHPNLFEYETQKGKRYGIRRGFTNSVGKKDEYTKSGFKTWRDADIVLKKFESDLAMDNISSITAQKVTVDQYWKKMSERKLELEIWKESTYKMQKQYYSKYLQPKFGAKTLNDVTRSSFQSFLDKLVLDGLANTTIRTITSIMLNIMNSAENEDIILKNKLKGMLIRGHAPKDLTVETVDYEKWIKPAQKILNKYMLAMIYIGALGERRGELMGLRTDSFTFKKQKNGDEICGIKIDLQRTSDFLNGTGLKTKSSYRTIWVNGWIIDYIKYAIITSDNLRIGNNINADKKWLWLNEKGEPFHPYHVNKITGKINKDSGIHITPHMLRHYFATKGMASNASDIEVMHWLGHSNLQMTADYTRPTALESLDLYSNVDSK